MCLRMRIVKAGPAWPVRFLFATLPTQFIEGSLFLPQSLVNALRLFFLFYAMLLLAVQLR